MRFQVAATPARRRAAGDLDALEVEEVEPHAGPPKWVLRTSALVTARYAAERRAGTTRTPRESPVVAPGLRSVQRSATICKVMTRMCAENRVTSIFRSKFNVALGIEAQGFCQLR
jgi:hypothetical protein